MLGVTRSSWTAPPAIPPEGYKPKEVKPSEQRDEGEKQGKLPAFRANGPLMVYNNSSFTGLLRPKTIVRSFLVAFTPALDV